LKKKDSVFIYKTSFKYSFDKVGSSWLIIGTSKTKIDYLYLETYLAIFFQLKKESVYLSAELSKKA